MPHCLELRYVVQASVSPAAHAAPALGSTDASCLAWLVRAQVLVFVNSADSGMRVRLFLEAFGIRAAVLSADQPLNSRHHILQVRVSARGAFHVLLLCMKPVKTCVGIAGR